MIEFLLQIFIFLTIIFIIVLVYKKYLGGGIGLWIGLCITIFNRIKRLQFKRVIKILIPNNRINIIKKQKGIS